MSHVPVGIRQQGMNTIHSIIYTVRDLDAAKAIHTALLGTEPHTDQPYYVGYHVDGLEIALRPAGDGESPAGPVANVLVPDMEAALAAAQQAGATLADPPNDVGGGLVATVTDPGGITLGLIQRG